MSSPTRSSATSSPPVSVLSLQNLSPISIEFSIHHHFTDFFNLEMDKSDVLLFANRQYRILPPCRHRGVPGNGAQGDGSGLEPAPH